MPLQTKDAQVHRKRATKSLAKSLPITGKVTDCVFNQGSKILYSLAYPDNPLSRLLYSVETVYSEAKNFLIARTGQTCRYLLTSVDEAYVSQDPTYKETKIGVAVLVVRHNQKHVPILEIIHVEEQYRRLGIATRLVERAHQDFPNLSLDGNLSLLGKKFFGAMHRTK